MKESNYDALIDEEYEVSPDVSEETWRWVEGLGVEYDTVMACEGCGEPAEFNPLGETTPMCAGCRIKQHKENEASDFDQHADEKLQWN